MGVRMATTTAISANPTRKFGRIAVRRAGNVTDRYNVSDSVNSHLPHYGAKPVVSSTIGTAKVNSSSSEFGRNDSEFIMHGVGVTTTIAGVANTAIKGAGSAFARRRVSKSEGRKTTWVGSATWLASGTVELPTYTFTRSQQTLSFGSDDAATYNASEKMEIAFMTGAANPLRTGLSW